MTYNYNAPWHTLKKVCLGKSYSPSFYFAIRNSHIKDVLSQIAEETEEDYSNIESILNQAGVEVVRPTLLDNSILDYVDANGKLTYDTARSCTLIPRPPMQPRDCQLVISQRYSSRLSRS